jgi:excisionase family DNA binding protein
MNEPPVLTAGHVASALRLSAQTVLRRFKVGGLPAPKIGGLWRMTRVDFDRLVGQS